MLFPNGLLRKGCLLSFKWYCDTAKKRKINHYLFSDSLEDLHSWGEAYNGDRSPCALKNQKKKEEVGGGWKEHTLNLGKTLGCSKTGA